MLEQFRSRGARTNPDIQVHQPRRLKYNGTDSWPQEEQNVFLRDLLVASVAFGLGLSMIQVAMINRGWCFDNFIIRRIESSRGREAARKSLWIGGTAIILVGAWTLVAPLLKKGKAESSIQGRYLTNTLQNGPC